LIRFLALATFAAGMALAIIPAQAQTYDPSYPVCMKVSGDPTYFECQYATMDQCRGNMKGRSAECLMNPYYGSAHKPAVDSRRRAN
jgi:Protein of unknown function (DUF3551)